MVREFKVGAGRTRSERLLSGRGFGDGRLRGNGGKVNCYIRKKVVRLCFVFSSTYIGRLKSSSLSVLHEPASVSHGTRPELWSETIGISVPFVCFGKGGHQK